MTGLDLGQFYPPPPQSLNEALDFLSGVQALNLTWFYKIEDTLFASLINSHLKYGSFSIKLQGICVENWNYIMSSQIDIELFFATWKILGLHVLVVKL